MQINVLYTYVSMLGLISYLSALRSCANAPKHDESGKLIQYRYKLLTLPTWKALETALGTHHMRAPSIVSQETCGAGFFSQYGDKTAGLMIGELGIVSCEGKEISLDSTASRTSVPSVLAPSHTRFSFPYAKSADTWSSSLAFI
jgi:hypothetical protein